MYQQKNTQFCKTYADVHMYAPVSTMVPSL